LDYITKQILEWNMAEIGMELESLVETATILQQTLRFPRFLQGKIFVVRDGKRPAFDIYHQYFRSTMSNQWRFSLVVHGLVVGVAVLSNSLFAFCMSASLPSQPN
jgi:hypothetical protein